MIFIKNRAEKTHIKLCVRDKFKNVIYNLIFNEIYNLRKVSNC